MEKERGIIMVCGPNIEAEAVLRASLDRDNTVIIVASDIKAEKTIDAFSNDQSFKIQSIIPHTIFTPPETRAERRKRERLNKTS